MPEHEQLKFAAHGESKRVETVWSAFTAAANAHPEAIALAGEQGDLTYRQLLAHVDAVADQLAERAIKPGDRVALLCQRDTLVPAAMLGIASLGAIFVPIETDVPAARRTQVLGLADCRAVVSNLPPEERPEGSLDLNAISTPTAGPRSAVIHDLAPDHAVSVMFTSGSTGQPKGVLIPHRAIVRLARAEILDLGPGCRFLHASSLAFDASTLEIWGPLLNGGTVVTMESKPDLKLLERLIREQHVTAAWLTAALFHLCADTNPAMFAPLTTLLTGGDVVSPKHAAATLAVNPHLRLVNGYGPTENTTFTTTYDITNPDPATPLPIGSPISGTGVVITDEQLRPVPAGETGELIATGDGLALGYLNDPGLTAAKFVTLHPSALRGYRTGDLGRINELGEIEFMGRNDDQVKINGFRVEMGEIEAVLRDQPAVRDAAVVIAAVNGEIRPHAFITLNPVDSWPEHRALIRRNLTLLLPAYAIPASLTHQMSIPVSTTGKIDRKLLRSIVEDGEPVSDGPTRFTNRILAEAARLLDQYWNPYSESPDEIDAPELSQSAHPDQPITLRAPGGGHATLTLRNDYIMLRLPPGTSERVRRWRCSDTSFILNRVVNGVNSSVASLPVMCDDELRTLESYCTTGHTAFKSGCLWTELVNASSGRMDSPAIVSESGIITFGQLLQSSRAAAKKLEDTGVLPGERIALMDRRNPQSLSWLFAILSKGCTCVPVTPEMPLHRVQSILRISVATRLIDPAKPECDTQDDFLSLIQHNRSRGHRDLAPGRDAMILFTSGSTAEPKGIRIRHDSILNTVGWFSDLLPLTEGDIVTQRSWFSWDCSILETMWPLFSGAAVALIDPAKTRDPGSFARLVNELHATVLVTIPSIVSRVCREIAIKSECHIRAVICAGEKLTATTVRDTSQFLNAQIFNVYGPSETSVITNCWKASSEFDEVPIGRPGFNVIITVQSEDGTPCPVGVTGEIVIHGIQVSDGYINLLRTAENPFCQSTKGEFAAYRTGDLGYWREDGNLSFVSRRDGQLKIFGFRIEPEEIESTLSRVSGVADCAATNHSDGFAQSIIALCVADAESGPPPTSTSITSQLQAQLEPYALPARYIWTAGIPRLANGKVDRRAVFELAQSALDVQINSDRHATHPATSGDISCHVRRSWAMLLGQPPVSNDDDFIKSGGNSLLLLRMMLILEQTTGIQLPMLPGFQDQTPTSIAQAFASARALSTSESAYKDGFEVRANYAGHLHKLTDGPEIVLAIPHLGGTVGFLSDLASISNGIVSIYAIQPTGLLENETPLTSIHDIICGYHSLIQDNKWNNLKILGFSSGASIAVGLAEKLSKSGSSVSRVLVVDGNPSYRPPAKKLIRRIYNTCFTRFPHRIMPLSLPGLQNNDISAWSDLQKKLGLATLNALYKNKLCKYYGDSTVIVRRNSPKSCHLSSWKRVLKGSTNCVVIECDDHMQIWNQPHAKCILEKIMCVE